MMVITTSISMSVKPLRIENLELITNFSIRSGETNRFKLTILDSLTARLDSPRHLSQVRLRRYPRFTRPRGFQHASLHQVVGYSKTTSF